MVAAKKEDKAVEQDHAALTIQTRFRGRQGKKDYELKKTRKHLAEITRFERVNKIIEEKLGA